MSRGREREFECKVVSETVLIQLARWWCRQRERDCAERKEKAKAFEDHLAN